MEGVVVSALVSQFIQKSKMLFYSQLLPFYFPEMSFCFSEVPF